MATKGKFENQLTQLAEGIKAMGHPARILILKHLLHNGPSSCQDIVDQLPYSQSTVSGHLQKLKDGKLITMKSVKTSSVYSIHLESIEMINKELTNTFNLKSESKKQMSLF
jgi:DNA-binding transcriptional ArsR family regulator